MHSEDQPIAEPQRGLSVVQEANLTLLLVVRETAATDAVMACARYGLSMEQAARLGAVKPTQIVKLVMNVGDQALFTPRADIDDLLSTSEALLPLVVAARHPAAVVPAGRGNSSH